MRLNDGAAPATRNEPAHRHSAATNAVQTIGSEAELVGRVPLQATLSRYAVHCGSAVFGGKHPLPPATPPDESARVCAASVRGDSHCFGLPARV